MPTASLTVRALSGDRVALHWPPGAPARLAGREAIREYSHQVMASLLQVDDFEVTELYQTQDPEVVIVEMRDEGDPHHDMGASRLRRRPSRSSASGRARSPSSATSPIPGPWKT